MAAVIAWFIVPAAHMFCQWFCSSPMGTSSGRAPSAAVDCIAIDCACCCAIDCGVASALDGPSTASPSPSPTACTSTGGCPSTGAGTAAAPAAPTAGCGCGAAGHRRAGGAHRHRRRDGCALRHRRRFLRRPLGVSEDELRIRLPPRHRRLFIESHRRHRSRQRARRGMHRSLLLLLQVWQRRVHPRTAGTRRAAARPGLRRHSRGGAAPCARYESSTSRCRTR